MMIEYCLGKSSTGKFRWWCIECDEEYKEHDYEGTGFLIQRSYGQVGGKTTYGPAIYVPKGKASRTAREQMKLQFKSELKKQLDKGYVRVDKHPNDYTLEELQEIYGDVATNQAGVIKPMLAKKQDDVTNRKIFDKVWYCSRKIDGVRCLIYYKDGQVHTASRGGDSYDYSTSHIIDHPKLIEWFSSNPNIILDGELYKKDISLQKISGAARMEKDANTEWLEFYLYDIADVNTVWRDRYGKLKEIAADLELTFDPYREWKPGELQIQLVPHEILQTEKHIWELHDKYVSEGWEGCVVRDPDKVYKPKGRTNDMIKFKNYQSEDFLVVGYELGLRGSEDMVFICEMENGNTFKAMPVGDRSVKAEYVENFEEKYNGHKAECTFFNYSDDMTPTQPKLRHFRFDLE